MAREVPLSIQCDKVMIYMCDYKMKTRYGREGGFF